MDSNLDDIMPQKLKDTASLRQAKKEALIMKLRMGKHIKPLVELPGFPIDIVQMKIRNRKLISSLNQKKRFKDFEYKNYDSTDSDVYEDEDFLKLTYNKDVVREKDFLRKRRM